MSKIYSSYQLLKQKDSQTIYLFKVGIFYIAIDQDAIKLSNLFNFKIGYLTENIVKCGFPCSSLDKYLNLFKIHNLIVKIINNTNYVNNIKNINDEKISQLINLINSVDVNSISVKEAYQFIEDLKSKASLILQ